jgi:hypothetical protein
LPNALAWTCFTLDFTAHPAYTSYYITLERESAISSSIFLDDVSVERVYDIQAAILWNHNLSETATVTLEGHTSDVWTSPAFSQAMTVYGRMAVAFLSTAKNYPWWRITVVDVGNPDGFFSVGRVYLGPYFEPDRNIIVGRPVERVDPSSVSYSEGHQASSVIREKYDIHNYNFERTEEKDEFDAMFDYSGVAKPLFLCETPDSPSGALFYVKFLSWGWTHAFLTKWNLAVSLEDYL